MSSKIKIKRLIKEREKYVICATYFIFQEYKPRNQYEDNIYLCNKCGHRKPHIAGEDCLKMPCGTCEPTASPNIKRLIQEAVAERMGLNDGKE